MDRFCAGPGCDVSLEGRPAKTRFCDNVCRAAAHRDRVNEAEWLARVERHRAWCGCPPGSTTYREDFAGLILCRPMVAS
jgi:hypothetical protein